MDTNAGVEVTGAGSESRLRWGIFVLAIVVMLGLAPLAALGALYMPERAGLLWGLFLVGATLVAAWPFVVPIRRAAGALARDWALGAVGSGAAAWVFGAPFAAGWPGALVCSRMFLVIAVQCALLFVGLALAKATGALRVELGVSARP